MAETELGILSAQCLDRRMSDKQTLTRKSPPGKTSQRAKSKVHWQFTTDDARIKLKVTAQVAARLGPAD